MRFYLVFAVGLLFSTIAFSMGWRCKRNRNTTNRNTTNCQRSCVLYRDRCRKGKRFHLLDVSVGYSQAGAECKYELYKLARINTLEEYRLARSVVRNEDAWIGLERRAECPTDFGWAKSSACLVPEVDARAWAPGEPEPENSCVHFRDVGNSKWATALCNLKKKVLCCSCVAPACSSEKTYHLLDVSVTYGQASRRCNNAGYHLATIDTRDEYRLARSVVGDEDAWIGLVRDRNCAGHFRWSDTNSCLPRRVNDIVWAHGEPSAGPCVHFRDVGLSKWATAPCRRNKKVLCQSCGEPEVECGKLQVPRPRIVGGENAGRNTHPWIVHFHSRNGNRLICHGVIISSRYVLTAKCEARDRRMFLFTFGDHRLSRKDRGQYSMLVPGRNFLPHPKYNESDFDYDYILVRLPRRLRFNKYVQPACLPEPCPEGTELTQCKPGTDVYIAGWGFTSRRGPISDILQEGVIRIRDFNKCQEIAGDDFDVTHQMMCAGTRGTAGCWKDIGGPLLEVGRRGRYTLCGIFSFLDRCGARRRFGFYSKVCAVVDWIKANTDLD